MQSPHKPHMLKTVVEIVMEQYRITEERHKSSLENVGELFIEMGCQDFTSEGVQSYRGFPGGSDSKESTCNAGDPGLIPGSGRSTGQGHRNLL